MSPILSPGYLSDNITGRFSTTGYLFQAQGGGTKEDANVVGRILINFGGWIPRAILPDI